MVGKVEGATRVSLVDESLWSQLKSIETSRDGVISLVFSREAAQLTETLLRKWMSPGTTVEEMESFIRQTLPVVNG